MIRRNAHPLLLAIGVSFAIVSLGLWLAGFSPFQAAKITVQSTWMTPHGIVSVLNKAMILMLTGLAVALPYRAGLFNIGGEGQLYMGAILAAWIGALPLTFAGPFHLAAALLAGTAAGMLWGGIAGWLRTARQIHEVIGTIMLNFIAFQTVNELTFGWLQAGPGMSRTALIHESARMPSWGSLCWGFTLSILAAIGLSVLLHRTWPGFHIRASGSNPEASLRAGIPVARMQCWAMALGGGCAGLAGALETTGINHAFYARFHSGSGFDGIAIAFLAMCEPWAVIPAALFLSTIRAADGALQLDMNLPKEIIFALEGILIICVAIFMKRTPRKQRKKTTIENSLSLASEN